MRPRPLGPPRRRARALAAVAAAAALSAFGGCAARPADAPASSAAPTPASADAGATAPGATDPAAARAEIAAMMGRAAAAWNRGDLDAFMEDYAPGEGTTYIGRRGLLRGPAAIRAAYAPRFAPEARRGTLRFEALEVDLLAPGVANAIATYVLTERTAAGADSTVGRGPTSLVMRRAGGRWRIVHDHSS